LNPSVCRLTRTPGQRVEFHEHRSAGDCGRSAARDDHQIAVPKAFQILPNYAKPFTNNSLHPVSLDRVSDCTADRDPQAEAGRAGGRGCPQKHKMLRCRALTFPRHPLKFA